MESNQSDQLRTGTVIAYCAGFFDEPTGCSVASVVLTDAQGNQLGAGAKALENCQNSPYAVYEALVEALEWAEVLGGTDVLVRSNSEVILQLDQELPLEYEGSPTAVLFPTPEVAEVFESVRFEQVEFKSSSEIQQAYSLAVKQVHPFYFANGPERQILLEIDWKPTPAGLKMEHANESPELLVISADSPIPSIALLAPDAKLPLWFRGQWHESVADAYRVCNGWCRNNTARVELMYNIVRTNLQQNSELMRSIREQYGLEWLQACTLQVGPSLAAGWKGKDFDSSPYLQCLYDAYQELVQSQAAQEQTMQVLVLGNQIGAFPDQASEEKAKRYLESALANAIFIAAARDKTCLRVIVGAEPGVDFWAAEEAISYRDCLESGAMEETLTSRFGQNALRMEVVVAVPGVGMEDQMTPAQQEQYAQILDAVDRVKLQHPPATTLEKIRSNRELFYDLDPSCDLVVAIQCPDDCEVQQRLELAKQRHLKIVVYDLQTDNKQTFSLVQAKPQKMPAKRKATKARL